MSTELKTTDNKSQGLEEVLVTGNLAKLTTEQRLDYYKRLCDSLGLNPLTKPFEYITLNGKLTLYARKDCTDQLRNIRSVSITKLEKHTEDGVHMVTAYAQDKSGRVDVATGVVSIGGLKGDNLANAYMKAEAKAKRRVTLSLVGLGILDETEIETIKDVSPEPIHVDEMIAEAKSAKDGYMVNGEFYDATGLA